MKKYAFGPSVVGSNVIKLHMSKRKKLNTFRRETIFIYKGESLQGLSVKGILV